MENCSRNRIRLIVKNIAGPDNVVASSSGRVFRKKRKQQVLLPKCVISMVFVRAEGLAQGDPDYHFACSVVLLYRTCCMKEIMAAMTVLDAGRAGLATLCT